MSKSKQIAQQFSQLIVDSIRRKFKQNYVLDDSAPVLDDNIVLRYIHSPLNEKKAALYFIFSKDGLLERVGFVRDGEFDHTSAGSVRLRTGRFGEAVRAVGSFFIHPENLESSDRMLEKVLWSLPLTEKVADDPTGMQQKTLDAAKKVVKKQDPTTVTNQVKAAPGKVTTAVKSAASKVAQSSPVQAVKSAASAVVNNPTVQAATGFAKDAAQKAVIGTKMAAQNAVYGDTSNVDDPHRIKNFARRTFNKANTNTQAKEYLAAACMRILGGEKTASEDTLTQMLLLWMKDPLLDGASKLRTAVDNNARYLAFISDTAPDQRVRKAVSKLTFDKVVEQLLPSVTASAAGGSDPNGPLPKFDWKTFGTKLDVETQKYEDQKEAALQEANQISKGQKSTASAIEAYFNTYINTLKAIKSAFCDPPLSSEGDSPGSVWVSSAPGMGKTTFISSILKNLGMSEVDITPEGATPATVKAHGFIDAKDNQYGIVENVASEGKSNISFYLYKARMFPIVVFDDAPSVVKGLGQAASSLLQKADTRTISVGVKDSISTMTVRFKSIFLSNDDISDIRAVKAAIRRVNQVKFDFTSDQILTSIRMGYSYQRSKQTYQSILANAFNHGLDLDKEKYTQIVYALSTMYETVVATYLANSKVPPSKYVGYAYTAKRMQDFAKQLAMAIAAKWGSVSEQTEAAFQQLAMEQAFTLTRKDVLANGDLAAVNVVNFGETGKIYPSFRDYVAQLSKNTGTSMEGSRYAELLTMMFPALFAPANSKTASTDAEGKTDAQPQKKSPSVKTTFSDEEMGKLKQGDKNIISEFLKKNSLETMVTFTSPGSEKPQKISFAELLLLIKKKDETGGISSQSILKLFRQHWTKAYNGMLPSILAVASVNKRTDIAKWVLTDKLAEFNKAEEMDKIASLYLFITATAVKAKTYIDLVETGLSGKAKSWVNDVKAMLEPEDQWDKQTKQIHTAIQKKYASVLNQYKLLERRLALLSVMHS